MNTKLVKYHLKSDLKMTFGYVLGLSFVMYIVGLVLDYKQPLGEYIQTINGGFPIVSLFYFMMIYLPMLNKTSADQWENFSLTRNDKFNLLAIRYCVSMLIPQIIFSILTHYLSFGLTSVNFWSYVPVILLPLMTYIFGMYCVFVSGHVAVAVIGIVTGSIVAESILDMKDYTNINPIVLWSLSFAIVCLMYLINKKIFQKREVEKLGRMFMFRWAEIVFTIGFTSFIGFIMNIIISFSSTTILEYIYVTFLMVLAYVLLDMFFITGFKVEKLKVKCNTRNVAIQTGIGVGLAVVVNIACVFIINI